MTRHKDRKTEIRQRMALTGEPYSVAARSVGTRSLPSLDDTAAGPEAYGIEPTRQDAWRLVGHYLHHRCHSDPLWRFLDQRASQLRDELAWLPVQRGQDVTVTMWLPLTTTAYVECTDPDCTARQMYLTSDGSGRLPASGPLPAFTRDGELAYFTYKTHPHGEHWAPSIDPETVHWMTTALALYGGNLRVDFMDYQPEGLALGHTLWSIAEQRATIISRHEMAADESGVTEDIHPSKDTGVYPPVPPEVLAERIRADHESSAGALGPSARDDLNPDPPVNAVACAHYESAADGRPALDLTPSGLLSAVMLPELLAAPLVCLAVEDPHEDCAPEHRSGPHQQLRLHMNAGAEYGHDGCVVAAGCVGCMPDLFDAIAAHQAGWIRYIRTGQQRAGQTQFQLGNPAASLTAIETARSRLSA
jgi:hypothetical protein